MSSLHALGRKLFDRDFGRPRPAVLAADVNHACRRALTVPVALELGEDGDPAHRPSTRLDDPGEADPKSVLADY